MVTKDQFIRLKLNKGRLDQIKSIAAARNNKQCRFGAMTYTGGRNTRGSLEAHVIGMIAEVAVGDYYGVDIDKRIFEDHGDDGSDLILPKFGVTQVKSTTYWSDPWLRAEVEHDHDGIQTYILVCVDTDDYENVCMCGWISRDDVIKLPQKRCKTSGPMNYMGGMSDLSPLPKSLSPTKLSDDERKELLVHLQNLETAQRRMVEAYRFIEQKGLLRDLLQHLKDCAAHG